jgi:hypothetical protein
MHLEVLTEEPSAEAALAILIPKIAPGVTFAIHPHQGKLDLLEQLPRKLRAYAKWVTADYRIVVLVDEDRADCIALKRKLVASAKAAGIANRVLSRIAVEELEAWFFGDVPALVKAYPGVPSTLASKTSYRQADAIKGGTWEALERVLQEAGHMSGGYAKKEGAATIAAQMNVNANASPSFQAFRDGVRRICNAA